MDKNRIPKQGEIYHHFKDRLYQIITVATHTETDEKMVVYQAMYGDFKSYVRPLAMFLSKVDKDKYPQVQQKYRFELVRTQDGEPVSQTNDEEVIKKEVVSETNIINPIAETKDMEKKIELNDKSSKQKEENIKVDSFQAAVTTEESVNAILLKFLDADSYNKKLEVLTSNTKHLTDRLVNDMAVALDCTVEDGPLDQRIQGLVHCLQAMRRFEDRRLR
jgi:hypothetical protein